ncbi:MAG: calcineurin-like phosphoesterase C-terminal domain-containing protein [Bacteroidaceae bacterium]|nr:calcineurin-like phosphoesterase C-terminal domain-containing protein [Bacteroidaceae bacterium]
MKKPIVILAMALSLGVMQTATARTMKVMGTVTDMQGQPIKGVTVSDGFTAVQTDNDGKYAFVRNEAAYYVHYSVPADCEVPVRYGHPCFFRKLDRDSVYNFHLLRKPGMKDTKVNLFFIADPQCQNPHHVRRLHNETVPDIREHGKTLQGVNYAITLGDIGYTEGEFNTNYILPMMREEMKEENMGMKVFQTNGNHDQIYEGLELNTQNPLPMQRYLRMFEDLFGPTDYSWNRGDVHIVSMNNVMYDKLNTAGKYHGELTKEQMEWLRQDLSFVPKDKLVLFCCHIPIWGTRNTDTLLQLLSQFPNVYIYSGHIHANRPARHKYGVKEFNLAAASGCWWWSRLNADGVPHGYQVVNIEGNKIVDQYWKSTRYPRSFQIRLYRGDCVFGGKYERDELPFGKKVVLANVFGWEPEWKVEVYENDKLMGEMERINPDGGRSLKPSLTSCQDWWAIGYHCGIIGRGNIGGSNRNSYISVCTHMFKYTMKKANAKIKVVATDPYGNRYEQTEMIEGNAFEPGNKVYETAVSPQYDLDPVWEYYH